MGDGNFDSAVFIKGGSVGTVQAEAIPEPKTILIKGGSVGTVQAEAVPKPMTVLIKTSSVGIKKAEAVPEPMTVGGLMVGGAMLAAGRKLRDRRK